MGGSGVSVAVGVCGSTTIGSINGIGSVSVGLVWKPGCGMVYGGPDPRNALRTTNQAPKLVSTTSRSNPVYPITVPNDPMMVLLVFAVSPGALTGAIEGDGASSVYSEVDGVVDGSGEASPAGEAAGDTEAEADGTEGAIAAFATSLTETPDDVLERPALSVVTADSTYAFEFILGSTSDIVKALLAIMADLPFTDTLLIPETSSDTLPLTFTVCPPLYELFEVGLVMETDGFFISSLAVIALPRVCELSPFGQSDTIGT